MSFYLKGLLFCALSSAVTVNAAGKEVCKKIQNYIDVVECAENRSPEIISSEAEINVKKSLVEAASQWNNPELGVDSLSGTSQADKKTETDVSLSFPLELGGKRSARKSMAEADLVKATKELQLQRAEVRKKVLLKLNRLRQIFAELELVKESQETFSKLVKQYQGRPALSPEQEVSLTVFKMAKGEYNFKKIEYEEELYDLASYFKVVTGLELDQVKRVLPSEVRRWPSLKEASNERNPTSWQGIYDATVDAAQGDLDKAKGDAWPTLMLGPSAKFTQEASGDSQMWGLNLSMSLPVFNLNGGAKGAAAANLQAARIKREQGLEQISQRRKLLESLYRVIVDTLAENPSGHELEQRHRKIESQFMRGLVSSSLVIEVHRSLVDFEKSRNVQEMKALETYLEIQVLDGQKVEWIL